MFLKNYTSEVPASQTIYRIEQVLIKCGVSGITKEYGPNASVNAIQFHIPSPNNGTMTVRLPADKERALDALWLNYADGDKLTDDGKQLDRWASPHKKKKRADFAEQVARTAWKIQQDWVQVQMSLIKLRQVEFLEVFMGFLWDGKQSYYNRLKTSGFKALPENAGGNS